MASADDKRADGVHDRFDLAAFQALSFDCYGTLIDWETGILAVLRPWATEVGVDADDEDCSPRSATARRLSNASCRHCATPTSSPSRSTGSERCSAPT